MFDLHTRQYRFIYPRCHDGVSGLSELNLCAERVSSEKPGINRSCAIVIQNAAKRSPEATVGRNKSRKRQTNAKKEKFFVFFHQVFNSCV